MNPRVASASLQCVNGQPLSDAFTGVIRQQDVRATEIDKARAAACMHVFCSNPSSQSQVMLTLALSHLL